MRLASPTAQGDPARLEVVFDNWFSRLFPSWTKGQYWIVHIGGDYDTAVVGTPNRKYLWILARGPALVEEAYTALVARCRALGFDTAALVRNPTHDLIEAGIEGPSATPPTPPFAQSASQSPI